MNETTIPTLTAFLASLTDSMINDATIDACATLLIPICDDEAFTLDAATDMLNATDHHPTLCAELLDTMRDNNYNNLDLESLT